MDRPEPRLDDLAAELRATEELPVERSAARWIGEAEAVAVDLARDRSSRRRRARGCRENDGCRRARPVS